MKYSLEINALLHLYKRSFHRRPPATRFKSGTSPPCFSGNKGCHSQTKRSISVGVVSVMLPDAWNSCLGL